MRKMQIEITETFSQPPCAPRAGDLEKWELVEVIVEPSFCEELREVIIVPRDVDFTDCFQDASAPHINELNEWGQTCLDEALRAGDWTQVKWLRGWGGMTGAELVQDFVVYV